MSSGTLEEEFFGVKLIFIAIFLGGKGGRRRFKILNFLRVELTFERILEGSAWWNTSAH